MHFAPSSVCVHDALPRRARIRARVPPQCSSDRPGPPTVQGNSGVYKVMGTMLLFVSFLSFNASSVQNWDRIGVAGLSGSNTMIAASTSAFAVMMWKTLINRFDMNVVHSIDGILAGCVSVTAGTPPPPNLPSHLMPCSQDWIPI